MGYFLQAIIGDQTLLQAHFADFQSVVVVALSHNLALIPMTDELLDEIGAGSEGQFYKLSPDVADWVRSISDIGPVAYVEAEFFGGIGDQNAIVWSHGGEILQLLHDRDAINAALQLLGISKGAFHDEFEAVGLPRHRDTGDWIKDAIPKE